jgi:hypothetical protein
LLLKYYVETDSQSNILPLVLRTSTKNVPMKVSKLTTTRLANVNITSKAVEKCPEEKVAN